MEFTNKNMKLDCLLQLEPLSTRKGSRNLKSTLHRVNKWSTWLKGNRIRVELRFVLTHSTDQVKSTNLRPWQNKGQWINNIDCSWERSTLILKLNGEKMDLFFPTVNLKSMAATAEAWEITRQSQTGILSNYPVEARRSQDFNRQHPRRGYTGTFTATFH